MIRQPIALGAAADLEQRACCHSRLSASVTGSQAGTGTEVPSSSRATMTVRQLVVTSSSRDFGSPERTSTAMCMPLVPV